MLTNLLDIVRYQISVFVANGNKLLNIKCEDKYLSIYWSSQRYTKVASVVRLIDKRSKNGGLLIDKEANKILLI